MKRILPTIILACVLAFASPESYSAQSMATIEGIVLDAATSQPLAGVRVSLASTTVAPVAFNPLAPPVPPPSATTDSQGHFSLETKEVGRVRIVPTRDGYIYSRPGQTRAPAEPGAWVQLSPGERIKDLEMRMARPAVISGRVLNADGQPIVGNAGSVALMRYTYGTDGKRSLGWIPGISYPGTAGSFQRMNDKGEFRFYDLPPGEYYLNVTGGGGAVGSARSYYYPGVTDEAKAAPIRVAGGEDIRLDLLTLPPREKGVEVKLRITGAAEPITRQRVVIAESSLHILAAPKPDEILLPSVAPGHYDILVGNDRPRSDLLYAFVALDIGNSGLDQEVVLKRGAKVTGKLVIENDSRERSPAPSTVSCRLRSRFGLDNCLSSQIVPGVQEVQLEGLPADAYVLSAKAGERDILAEGLNVTGDTELEIVFATPGAMTRGTVRNAERVAIPGAPVALVPDAPYRATGLLYRSVITDPNGKFEIHGIAPGSYKLFAWPELEGAAYRNADFMKEYEERGKPVKVGKGARVSVDLTAF